ncbi:hypothetical protein CAOG_05800 [Capsaspora owczarzaki ATCC 30864]|uniref:Uncharacterized protein n=1 Tax=Capsaspora owczarzaki (strain ATCC 30864) TaxID=595528 RepID=A0A0D2WSS6_CAPO3|nr:hypothetical protein CAOG_05800 [Capsaspora owczarzaki ATCC 30864]KJE95345.1 hypothetical protein CAOG_005800 [Capsaspora owczarzaki ATCC 30864]|eukprot:XP_004345390.2 hypothetical protein CAOG_05800 [Capsaspora owczarzaki ATCC 30864]
MPPSPPPPLFAAVESHVVRWDAQKSPREFPPGFVTLALPQPAAPSTSTSTSTDPSSSAGTSAGSAGSFLSGLVDALFSKPPPPPPSAQPDEPSAASAARAPAPAPTECAFLPLSPVDQFCAQFDGIGVGWAFRGSLSPAALLKSLARTVTELYPHLTGRIVKAPSALNQATGLRSRIAVRCSNEGFPFIVGQLANVPVDALSLEDPLMRAFTVGAIAVPELKFSTSGAIHHPLIKVHVCRLVDNPDITIIGLCIIHAVMDGSGFFRFFKDWSDVHQDMAAAATAIPRCVFETSKMMDGIALDELQRLQDDFADLPSESPRRTMQQVSVLKFPIFAARALASSLTTGGFAIHFTDAEIANMKHAASAGLSPGEYVTTNDVLAAHMWRITAKLRELPLHSPVHMHMFMNMRNRKASLPDLYGTAATLQASVTMGVDELSNEPFHRIVQHLHATVQSNGETQFNADISWLQRQADENDMSRMMIGADLLRNGTILTHWAHFPVFGADFGTGHPFFLLHGAPPPLPNFILVSSAPPGLGGVVVYGTLPNSQARALMQEPWKSWLHSFRSQS